MLNGDEKPHRDVWFWQLNVIWDGLGRGGSKKKIQKSGLEVNALKLLQKTSGLNVGF